MIRSLNLRPLCEHLEGLSTGELFGLFEFFCKTKSTAVTTQDLAEAWGHLFSGIYLSAEELVHGMGNGEHLLGEDREKVLRGFIQADCRTGGDFVLKVIRKGGKMDRAALIMIADLEDLVGVKTSNTTAFHLLAGACDKTVRPIFIGRAGKKALSELYDMRGMPVLFTILGLNDLVRNDMIAIKTVFTRNELRQVKTKNRTSKNGLELFSEVSRRLRGRAPSDRNTFGITQAVRSTNFRGELKSQMRSSEKGRHLPGTDVMGESRGEKSGDDERQDVSDSYEDIMTPPFGSSWGLIRKKSGPK